jgi:putative transcriptional regulator
MINKLCALRIKNKYTYLNMSQKLNISKTYYWQIENKKRNLSYSLAKQIANIFNLKPDDIFYDDEHK